MLFDVGAQGRNLLLNTCFLLIALCGILALVPWGSLGADELSRLLRWLALPCLAIALVYELAMPSGYNIRVDLLLLVPIYAVVLATSAFRWVVRS